MTGTPEGSRICWAILIAALVDLAILSVLISGIVLKLYTDPLWIVTMTLCVLGVPAGLYLWMSLFLKKTQ